MRKTLFLLSVALTSGTLWANAPAVADSTGLPGDDLDLRGALALFKDAKDLESFEKALNDPDKHVNNLDLNGDGKVDYIRVVDHADGMVHAIALQAVIGTKDDQDVAMIGLEKKGEREAVIQIIGDSELYGDSAIYEPIEEKMDSKGSGPAMFGAPYMDVWVNVWGWPCVTWLYGPAYVIWISPWYWDYYPFWWHPWSPFAWRVHWGYCQHHYHHWYHSTSIIYVNHANTYYGPRRVMSTTVHQRYADAHRRYEAQSKGVRNDRQPNARPERAQPQPNEQQRPTARPDQQKDQRERPVQPQQPAKPERPARPDRTSPSKRKEHEKASPKQPTRTRQEPSRSNPQRNTPNKQRPKGR
ncbi:MAG: hypothetical protein H6597_02990 [Flavobacteriales bacterium]|nr:hypothetical protein [Flavobacteriales bacterium]MCB9193472.1 hypothetical protein [Flavobacteriales bacterium]